MDLTGLTRREAEELMAEMGQPDYRGRQLFQWVQARRVATVEAMSSLARTLRAELAARTQEWAEFSHAVNVLLMGTPA